MNGRITKKDNIVRVGRQEYHVIAGNDHRSGDRVQGLSCHSALVDEATLIPKPFFEMALSRLMYNGSKVWATCNPQGPKHWLKAEYIDAGRVAERHKFTFEDNPVLTDSVKARYRATFSGVFARRMIDGQWATAEGVIYHDVRTAKFTETKARKIVRVVCGADYGAASPSAFTFLYEIWGQCSQATRVPRAAICTCSGRALAGGISQTVSFAPSSRETPTYSQR